MIDRNLWRALTYHSIAEGDGREDTVSPQLLRDHLTYFRKEGWHSLSPEDFADGGAVPTDDGRRGFLLTFDDGYADTLSATLPLLLEFGCRAIVFVATDYVGGTDAFNGDDRECRKPMLSWDGIRELRAAGVDIGSHSCSHPSLSRVPLKEAAREIFESKARLESQLSAPVDYFAYPYGQSTPAVERLVEAAGYKAAFAGPGPVAGPYRIPRVAIGGADSIPRLRLKVGPAYRLVRRAGRLLSRYSGPLLGAASAMCPDGTWLVPRRAP